MRFVTLDDSIEGLRVFLEAQDLNVINTPRWSPTVSGRLEHRFTLRIRAVARIALELSPKTASVSAVSHLDEGDELFAKVVKGYSFAPLPDKDLVRTTGAHRGQVLETQDFTYARIQAPFPQFLSRS